MDFTFTTEQEAFRAHLRSWLERNKAEVFGRDSDPLADRDEDGDVRWQKTLEWHRRSYGANQLALDRIGFTLSANGYSNCRRDSSNLR